MNLHWLSHLLGIDNESGGFYAFWSGAGGDFGLIGALGVFLRHRNCHARRCWRLGRHPVGGTGFTVCRRHHPDEHPTVGDIHAAAAEAKERA